MSSKVPLVVTQSSSEQQTLPEVPPRPHSLHFLTPDLEAADGSGEYDDNAGAGFNKERRGSKSCLKVSSDFSDATGGSRSPCLSVGSPARRRSVHFNASPVHSTVEVRLVTLSLVALEKDLHRLAMTFTDLQLT